jgi:formate hydrogenlyase subunit 3/multisubunit Na+/H+ antiporter MnhD subunit
MSASSSFAWLLLALWVWPLLCALIAARTRWRWLPALGALPALGVAALLPTDTRLALPWLLLGTELGLDVIGKVFLLFSALLWLIAGVFVAALMRPGADSFPQRRFNALFLLAMSGQFWAVVGLDVISFYVGFALMGLAAYALVVADGSTNALRAGRLYLAMTVAGEVALFAGLVSLAAETNSLTPDPEMLARASGAALALVLLGLGVKAAIVPLHLWLPLTYPVAPVAATAVLSSAMIKVAVLGWLRWLPLGAVAWPDWALGLSLLGLGTALFALAVGLMQREPKVVLAYSSIAKMGFLLLLTGLMLSQPEQVGVGVSALVFYAAHHALCKAGLFLGLGLYERQPAGTRAHWWLLAGLGVLALALAGAPLTSGAVAKYLTKPLLQEAPWEWLAPLLWLMTLAAMLLMARFLWLLWPDPPVASTPGGVPKLPALAWSLLLGVVVLVPWVFGSAASWLTNGVNVLLALACSALVLGLSHWGKNPLAMFIGRVPPGDLLWPLQLGMHTLSRLVRWLRRVWRRPPGRLVANPRSGGAPEAELRAWPVAGALWLGIGALLLLLLIAG